MHRSSLALTILIAAAANASAMTPATAKFLREIGIDPKSKEVALVDKEGTVKTVRSGDDEEFSLDSMAAQKKKNGIKDFIATRVFIRLLKKDYAGTSIPKTNYNPLYLTPEERALVGKKFLEQIPEKKD